MVVVSPLMRALETAAGAFGAGPFKGEGRPLMLSQTEDLDERAPHAAVACPEGIPFIAFEGCRERLGGHAWPKVHSENVLHHDQVALGIFRCASGMKSNPIARAASCAVSGYSLLTGRAWIGSEVAGRQQYHLQGRVCRGGNLRQAEGHRLCRAAVPGGGLLAHRAGGGHGVRAAQGGV